MSVTYDWGPQVSEPPEPLGESQAHWLKTSLIIGDVQERLHRECDAMGCRDCDWQGREWSFVIMDRFVRPIMPARRPRLRLRHLTRLRWLHIGGDLVTYRA